MILKQGLHDSVFFRKLNFPCLGQLKKFKKFQFFCRTVQRNAVKKLSCKSRFQVAEDFAEE